MLLFFAPNSFMDSFVDGPLRHVIVPAVHVASWHHFLCPSGQVLFCFGRDYHYGAGSRSVSLFPPNNSFIYISKKANFTEITLEWSRDSHTCDFKWWFVVFRINIIKKKNVLTGVLFLSIWSFSLFNFLFVSLILYAWFSFRSHTGFLGNMMLSVVAAAFTLQCTRTCTLLVMGLCIL